MLSKKASVIVKSSVEKINGSDPNIAMLSHEREVSKKAWCKFNFLSWFRFDKKNSIPNTIDIIEATMKDESTSEYMICVKIGMTIDIPRII